MLVVTLAMLAFLGPTHGAESNSVDGRRIALRNCGGCHAIDQHGASPMSAAPPFRDVAARYPPEDLEEALAEGMLVGHSPMPVMQLNGHEREGLIRYLRALRTGAR